MSEPIRYVDWEGVPAMLRGAYAFGRIKGEWRRVNLAVVAMEGEAVTVDTFKQRFGDLPPPPWE